MIRLPDVNVLVSLAWPNHVHHAAAHDWFDTRNGFEWATTPITEVGFVRLSSNSVVVDESLSPAEAVNLLAAITALDGHVFLPDDIEGVVGSALDTNRLGGYRRVTDAHLLALAGRHGARLVTFDRGVSTIATDPDIVELLRA